MRFTTHLGALLLASLGVACSGSESPARSAVLITLEATRRDALGAYGSGAGATPNLDLLAQHAVLYQWARTVSPLSRPAHASIATGLYPPRHGVRGERSARLVDSARTVAEVARDADFQTAAFVGSRLLDEASGLDQGFEHFGRPAANPDGASEEIVERRGLRVIHETSAWLRRRDRERPFFVWVHLFDPHLPRRGRLLGAGDLSPYQAEVAATDFAVGELVEVLRSERLFRETFVAVVGAHGEGLGDHGELTHGLGLWDSTLRVPLLLCYRDGFGAGEESGETVSVVDLAPTLLEAMDLDVAEGLDGTSLYYQSVASDRGIYFESYEGWTRFGWSPLVGFADARGKFVRGARDELFDPRRDPAELAPLPIADGVPERYPEGIRAVYDAPRLASAEPEVDARILEDLIELGYTVPELGPTHRPLPSELEVRLRDPRDNLAEHETIERARRSVRAGDFEGALMVLEDLRSRHFGSSEVLDLLAEALVATEQHSRAVEVLRTRLMLPPESIETHRDLRICFSLLGDEARARRHSIRSLELLVEHHQRGGDLEALRRTRVLLDRTRQQAGLEIQGASAH